MGEPKFSRPKTQTPTHPWKQARIEEEHALKEKYGLNFQVQIIKLMNTRKYQLPHSLEVKLIHNLLNVLNLELEGNGQILWLYKP